MDDTTKTLVQQEKRVVFDNLIKQGQFLIDYDPEQLTGDFLRVFRQKIDDLIVSDF